MKRRIINILTGIMYGAILLSAIVGAILVINFARLEIEKPLENQTLENLRTVLEDNPGNMQILKGYRDLHLLSRGVFFTSVYQMETGRNILLTSLVIFFLSIQLINLLENNKVGDSKLSGKKRINNRTTGFYGIVFSALFLAGAGMIFSYFSNPEPVVSVEENSVFDNELTGNWPSFRGPGGNGKAYFTDVPDSWNTDTGENIIWRQKLELEGLSSPVIWDNQIYLTGGSREKFIIYCYSFTDGAPLWKYTVKDNKSIESGLPEVSPDTGFAAASAAVDSKGVYGIFASGNLIALDHNGKLRWEKNLGTPENIYGHSSSLIILDNLLFVQYDHNRDGALYAFDTGTGDIVWKVKREMGTSWASPILAPGTSGIYLVLSSNPFVSAYNPYTGEELWRTDCLGGEVASSPAYYKGVVYAAAEFSYLNALDVNTGVILWQDYEFLPDTSSLALTNDSVYLCTSYGVFACFDREKGELEWFTEDLSPKGCYSSPIIVGDRIFILTREGESVVFSSLKENKVLGRSQINENIDTTPAFYKNRIIIRGKENLYCIGFKENNNE